MGISRELLDKPVVGIAMTPSGFNNCHRYMPDLVEAVSRGVLAAGALPRAFPTVSLGEVFLNPTSMVYRNLMAMDTEEMIGAQPIDAVGRGSESASFGSHGRTKSAGLCGPDADVRCALCGRRQPPPRQARRG